MIKSYAIFLCIAWNQKVPLYFHAVTNMPWMRLVVIYMLLQLTVLMSSKQVVYGMCTLSKLDIIWKEMTEFTHKKINK